MGGWHSDDIINETHTEFVKLKNKIEDTANIYHHDMQFKKIYHQKIDNHLGKYKSKRAFKCIP